MCYNKVRVGVVMKKLPEYKFNSYIEKYFDYLTYEKNYQIIQLLLIKMI